MVGTLEGEELAETLRVAEAVVGEDTAAGVPVSEQAGEPSASEQG